MTQVSRRPGFRRIRLSEWARGEGIARITAYRMLRRGLLPVPSERSPTGRWYVFVPESTRRNLRYVVYARSAPGHDSHDVINQQLFSALRWAQDHQYPVYASLSEVHEPYVQFGPKLLSLLADPSVSGIIIDHPHVVGAGRLRLLAAALAAHDRSFLLVNRIAPAPPPISDVKAAVRHLCGAILTSDSAASAAAEMSSVLDKHLSRR